MSELGGTSKSVCFILQMRKLRPERQSYKGYKWLSKDYKLSLLTYIYFFCIIVPPWVSSMALFTSESFYLFPLK